MVLKISPKIILDQQWALDNDPSQKNYLIFLLCYSNNTLSLHIQLYSLLENKINTYLKFSTQIYIKE